MRGFVRMFIRQMKKACIAARRGAAGCGDDNLPAVDKLKVYPNPAYADVTFDMSFNQDMENVSLAIYDVNGRRVGGSVQRLCNQRPSIQVHLRSCYLVIRHVLLPPEHSEWKQAR